jgi:hypothetical protein
MRLVISKQLVSLEELQHRGVFCHERLVVHCRCLPAVPPTPQLADVVTTSERMLA